MNDRYIDTHTHTHTRHANADEIEHQIDANQDGVSQVLVLETGLKNQDVRSNDVYGLFAAEDEAEIQQLQVFCACTGQHHDGVHTSHALA